MRSMWLSRACTAFVIVVTGMTGALAGGGYAGAATTASASRTDRAAGPVPGHVATGRPDVAAAGTPRLHPAAALTGSGTVSCPGGCAVNARSGPSTGYGVVVSLGDGTPVTVYCTARGEWESGQWGATNLWDNIGGNQYVSDSLVDTGGNDPTAGDCGVSSGSGINPFAYPWGNVGAGNWVDDGHGYYEGECVSYAAWAVRAESHSVSPDFLGNADQWNSHGVPSGGARAGDVAMWDDNVSGAGSVGHVAFVTAVFTDGTVQVSEYNWYNAHGYDSRRIGAGEVSRYLHFF